jgi:hypothetical protein
LTSTVRVCLQRGDCAIETGLSCEARSVAAAAAASRAIGAAGTFAVCGGVLCAGASVSTVIQLHVPTGKGLAFIGRDVRASGERRGEYSE